MNLCRYFLICLAIVIISCKNDVPERPTPLIKENTEYEENPLKRERIEEMKKKSKNINVPALRAQAISILNYRAEKDTNSYAIIEADIWEYEFVYNGEMSKPGEYTGTWIDFLKDGTYEYGKYSELQGSGRFSYHFERGELLMVDNDSSMKPQEWTVKAVGDVMVLVGTATYKDNAIQMKLMRVNDKIRTKSN